ncbi:MAG TPA: hypothetical protein VD999_05700 [Vitreimonas sp.]|nr:hypothetical protein [Vitreimonas sp.]
MQIIPVVGRPRKKLNKEFMTEANAPAQSTPPTGDQNPQGGASTPNTDSSSDSNSNALTDDQIELALKDERVWKHPRFKETREQAKLAKQLQEEKRLAEEQQLKDQNKWKEIADKKEGEIQQIKTKAAETAITAAIQAKAVAKGIVDPDAAAKLIDRSKISLSDEDWSISGVEEAIDSLIKDKPYLVAKNAPKPPIGSPTAPADGNQPPMKFKLSQLNDHKFYKEHEAQIVQAMKLGLVENDMQQ